MKGHKRAGSTLLLLWACLTCTKPSGQEDLDNKNINNIETDNSAAVSSFQEAPETQVWDDDPLLLKPVSPRLVAQLLRVTKRLDSLSLVLADTRAADCMGFSPAILPVINNATVQLDTLAMARALFVKAPPNLGKEAIVEWDRTNQDLAFLFPDGRDLLKASEMRPLSESLIRASGLSLHSRASAASNSLAIVLASLNR